jgi:hypothetical protein
MLAAMASSAALILAISFLRLDHKYQRKMATTGVR